MHEKNKPLILLVEPDPELQSLLKLWIEHLYGYTVVAADNGGKAVELATLHAFALILIDLQLPAHDGFDGYTTIEHLHNLQRFYRQPATIVAFSNYYWDANVREKVLLCGAVDCLDKLAIFQRLTHFLALG